MEQYEELMFNQQYRPSNADFSKVVDTGIMDSIITKKSGMTTEISVFDMLNRRKGKPNDEISDFDNKGVVSNNSNSALDNSLFQQFKNLSKVMTGADNNNIIATAPGKDINKECAEASKKEVYLPTDTNVVVNKDANNINNKNDMKYCVTETEGGVKAEKRRKFLINRVHSFNNIDNIVNTIKSKYNKLKLLEDKETIKVNSQQSIVKLAKKEFADSSNKIKSRKNSLNIVGLNAYKKNAIKTSKDSGPYINTEYELSSIMNKRDGKDSRSNSRKKTSVKPNNAKQTKESKGSTTNGSNSGATNHTNSLGGVNTNNNNKKSVYNINLNLNLQLNVKQDKDKNTNNNSNTNNSNNTKRKDTMPEQPSKGNSINKNNNLDINQSKLCQFVFTDRNSMDVNDTTGYNALNTINNTNNSTIKKESKRETSIKNLYYSKVPSTLRIGVDSKRFNESEKQQSRSNTKDRGRDNYKPLNTEVSGYISRQGSTSAKKTIHNLQTKVYGSNSKAVSRSPSKNDNQKMRDNMSYNNYYKNLVIRTSGNNKDNSVNTSSKYNLHSYNNSVSIINNTTNNSVIRKQSGNIRPTTINLKNYNIENMISQRTNSRDERSKGKNKVLK
jgi:hypothetical protein